MFLYGWATYSRITGEIDGNLIKIIKTMKRNLNNRLKKIEDKLNVKKKVGEIALLVMNGEKSSEYKELLEREKNGEKIDWDRYVIINMKNLKAYEQTKGH